MVIVKSQTLHLVRVDRCHNGRVLGESASVRIFNVEHIKGLEFEAAFFHNMGAIAARFPTLAEKLLYVGLSRSIQPAYKEEQREKLSRKAA